MSTSAAAQEHGLAGKILFISNGHGEDTDTSYLIRALRIAAPGIETSAVPLVGNGNSYRSIDVPIVAPTLVLPSGWMMRTGRSSASYSNRVINPLASVIVSLLPFAS